MTGWWPTWPAPRREELVGTLKGKPGLRRYLRRIPAGLRRIDHGAVDREAHLDGKWLLRTSDVTLTPDDLAAAYEADRRRTRLAGHEGRPGAAAGVPPPAGR